MSCSAWPFLYPPLFMRINRYLASAGLASRRASEAMVLEGRVKVNGHLVKDLSFQVGPDAHVTVDGKKVRLERTVTVLLNKPTGVICSTQDQERRQTVFDCLPEDFPRMFYVGRLDLDSEGMLVMTNNGELSQKLTHPKFKISKIYHVKLDREFDFSLAAKMKKGFLIEPGFAQVDSIYHLKGPWLKVILTQGLKRQIRLMFLKIGYRVRELKRVQIGNLEIGSLKPGKWRYLKDEEIQRDLLGAASGIRRKLVERRPASKRATSKTTEVDKGKPASPRVAKGSQGAEFKGTSQSKRPKKSIASTPTAKGGKSSGKGFTRK